MVAFGIFPICSPPLKGVVVLTDKIACYVCGFENHEDGAEFCEECGSEIYNYCSSSNCKRNRENGDQPCNQTAKFCPSCGSKTTFFLAGYLDDEDENQ